MKHGSIFTGIGGFDLAARWMGWQNIFQVEKDQDCQAVLKKNFPNTTRYADIFDFDGSQYNGKIDILTGGFPCQPFSAAGKQLGTADERHLWPEMLRVIRSIQPSYIVGENVARIATIQNGMVLKKICTDLEAENYTVELYNIPACSAQAPHQRQRIWIVAYTNSKHRQRQQKTKPGGKQRQARQEKSLRTRPSDRTEYRTPATYTNGTRLWGQYFRGIQSETIRSSTGYTHQFQTTWLEAATTLCRVDDGLSARLDKTRRLKQLGNAVVPQIPYLIFQAINNIEINKL